MLPYVRPEIARMQGYVPGEQPPPGKCIKLNTNENPYPPSPRVIAALRNAAERGLQRYPDPDATAFRMAAADRFGLDPSWILCGNGSDELLTMLLRTFVSPGEWIRYPTPTYVLYKTLGQAQGASLDECAFESDWSLPDDFASRTPPPKLALIANPNSPSGTLISPDRVREIARQLACPLVVDEAYVDFSACHCLDLVRDAENLLVTRSLSKSYALAGLRFGFLVARPELVREIRKVKDSYNCDTLSIAGATAAIADESWLAETRGRILATRARLRDALLSLGFHIPPSEANFLWCVRTDKIAPRALYERLREDQILVRYMKYPNDIEGLRVSVGSDEQCDACLRSLRRAIDALASLSPH